MHDNDLKKEWLIKVGTTARHLKQAEGVLARVSTAVMNHHEQKQAGKEGVCLTYTSTALCITEGRRQGLKQGRNLEAGADAEGLEGCCLLA